MNINIEDMNIIHLDVFATKYIQSSKGYVWLRRNTDLRCHAVLFQQCANIMLKMTQLYYILGPVVILCVLGENMTFQGKKATIGITALRPIFNIYFCKIVFRYKLSGGHIFILFDYMGVLIVKIMMSPPLIS